MKHLLSTLLAREIELNFAATREQCPTKRLALLVEQSGVIAQANATFDIIEKTRYALQRERV